MPLEVFQAPATLREQLIEFHSSHDLPEGKFDIIGLGNTSKPSPSSTLPAPVQY